MIPSISPFLRIGTCSWKYDSWKGLVYSDHVGKHSLAEYAALFELVEIDQWFWSLFGDTVVMPRPETVLEYVDSVPADFRFSIKVPNSITLTHHYQKGRKGSLEKNPHFLSNQLTDDFLKLLQPMKSQINSLIFQFEYLNKQKMGGQLEFLDKLAAFFKKCPSGYRYCVEIRNPNYLNRHYFDLLNALHVSHVFLQGYWMPPVFDVYRRFRDDIQTHTVIRLLGPDRSDIENKTGKQWNRIIEPREEDLIKLKHMIDDLLSREVKVTLNVNNHFEGSAPLTIERFKHMLAKTTD